MGIFKKKDDGTYECIFCKKSIDESFTNKVFFCPFCGKSEADILPYRLNQIILEKFNNNQKAFGRHMGYPQGTVNMWCKGTRTPRVSAIIEICNEFNVSADWLLGLKEEK